VASKIKSTLLRLSLKGVANYNHARLLATEGSEHCVSPVWKVALTEQVGGRVSDITITSRSPRNSLYLVSSQLFVSGIYRQTYDALTDGNVV
jgi:hypothetical protein